MNLKNKLANAECIGIISHMNPDGDNLGSLTALMESLIQINKNTIGICLDTVPKNLMFLNNVDKLENSIDYEFDILFVLDTSSIDLLGKGKKYFEESKFVINIDHHITNSLNCDINILDKNASSTGEVLYKFLRQNDLPINKDVAESIFTAISSDSGSFKYDCTSPETFRIAADLLSFGIDKEKINTNLYSRNSIPKVKLLSRTLNRMKIDKEKKIAYSYVLIDDFEELDAKKEDTEGLVEYMRDIEDIELAIFLKEKEDCFKVSTRSKNYDVSKLAEKFGGGGHIKAAGFSIFKHNPEEVFDIIFENL